MPQKLRMATATTGLLAACLFGWSAFGSVAFAATADCRDLKQTRYWRISYLIYPKDPLPDQRVLRELDGFAATLTAKAKDGVWIDIDAIGRGDDQNETAPDHDDFFVPAADKLYFLEAGMGDDYLGGDTDFGDEAVVTTDAADCILTSLHKDPGAAG
ncbi:MAG TPA: hypothetical protein VFK80_02990 [Limnochordia bacterium]|nr:hypothetical protein [Limnochordia bacterium]